MKKFLVVGSGFSGAVVARELAENIDCRIDILEKRTHIAGNCYTETNEDTGITIHKYGSHIFHTSNDVVWSYINKYARMMQFINRPKALTSTGIYSLPINLHTINQFFGLKLSPSEAFEFIENKRNKGIKNPANFEEQALSWMGNELYQEFFYGYTKKHWGCEPREIPSYVLKRLPLRYNYNDNYYRSIYQGIPEDGYTEIIERILDLPNINIQLGTTYQRSLNEEYDFIFYTGPLDEYYNYEFGRLSYRTVYWEKEIGRGDILGHPAINFPSLDYPFTRRREHKHYKYWKSYDKSIVFTEYSKETGIDDDPYYPIRLGKDKKILARYYQNVLNESNVTFLGRLALYKYMDMHQVISDSLEASHSYLSNFYNSTSSSMSRNCEQVPPSRRKEIKEIILSNT